MEHDNNSKKVAIIGAGLAGCALVYELSQHKDFSITIFDKNSDFASEASGNFAGILRPSLTNDNNFSEQFHTLGYEILNDYIKKNQADIEICSKGVLHVLSNPKEALRYSKIFANRQISSDLAVLLDSKESSKLLGKKIDYDSIYYPNALSLIPKSLCKSWLNSSKAKLKLDSELKTIEKTQNQKWLLQFQDYQEEFDIVIFAGAYELFSQIDYLKNISVYPSQGQLTVIKESIDTDFTIMDKGYLIPHYLNNLQVIGATFRENSDTSGEVRDCDHQENLNHVKEIFPEESIAMESILDARVSTRCVTSDHLPLVGKLVDYDLFREMFFKPLSKGYPKNKMPNVIYEEGLYLSSGFGSKGISSSLLSAKIISNLIRQDQKNISDKLLEALSPQRFLVRTFKKG
ncbi:FAD-dependent 5-carboxymethylaminomethyl-2-thiouridine(34) oxidoreductase MnmC [Francisella frigiditurris]|uniref:tRNA U-34 5-methylaminomethyl-2-thiouridine biosynthesis protein MnmC n=1 Tax=Francisella frigiditurris TaxID=1542390 RepID=A0A1J0KUE9_9GAMM|nr:FAD-dependent 5-carboxymethylaminomethyl-2-thiouridine(34) oxidoreductase MnmC [Francisella frigiditurris]APC97260.1 tRNA U-34 5-methylaminomethyl-2-thiouridine biosynthesis protein MnmC [Francisella frigiditurris]